MTVSALQENNNDYASPAASSRRSLARVWLFFSAFFLLFSSGRIDSVDPKAQLQAALLLVHTGRLGTKPSPMPQWPNVWVANNKGTYYQAHDLGGVVFMLPAAWLGSKLTRQSLADQIREPPWPSRFLVAISYTLFAAVGCLFLFQLFALLYPPRTAFLLSLAFATTTIFWAYTKSAYDVLGACVGVCWLLSSSAWALRATRVGAWDGARIGLAFVVACSFRYSLAPFLFVGMALVLRQLRRTAGWRPVVWGLATIGLVLFPSLVYNAVRTGSPLRTGATGLSSPLLALQGDLAAGLIGLFFSPNRGLFVFAPVLLLVFALPFVWRQTAGTLRQLVLYFGLSALGYTLLIAKMNYWPAVGGWGPRYLVPILPILFLGVAPVLVHGWRRYRRPLGVLVAVSALLGVPPVLVNHGLTTWAYPRAGDPWASQPAQQFSAWNGLLLGLQGEPLPAPPQVQADPMRSLARRFPDLWVVRLIQYSAAGAVVGSLIAVALVGVSAWSLRQLLSAKQEPEERAEPTSTRPSDLYGLASNAAGAKQHANPERSHTLHDVAFLSFIVLLSVLLYVQGLGFYSDDWSFLSYFSLAVDQSVSGLFRAVYSPHVQMRPIQILYYALLYKWFGMNPHGYHFVNTFVFGAGIVFFYLALRALNQKRLLCVAVPLVYALLPHYSTNRFWFATFNANLSMALFFLSGYAGLRALQTTTPRAWAWKLVGLAALVGSALAYEVFLPLFLLSLALMGHHDRQRTRTAPVPLRERRKLALLLSSNLGALLLVAVFKAWTTIRLGNETSFVRHVGGIVKQSFSQDYPGYGLNFKRALEISYGNYGLGLPKAAGTLARDYPDPAILAMAMSAGLLVFGYLYLVAAQTGETGVALPPRRGLAAGIGAGLAIFVLGYAIFCTNRNLQLTPTGMGNRTAIAAAVGVALVLVGAIGWVTVLLLRQPHRDLVFCALVALLCAGGFLINNTLGFLWVAAHRQQRLVLARIRQQFPALPKGTTFVLDGVCTYVGPAVVFESSWDLAGALQMFYADPTLRADVTSPAMKVRENGLTTSLYGIHHHYPYHKMLVYNFGRNTAHPIRDAEDARRYFQTSNPDRGSGCLRGEPGHGVPVL